MAKPYLQSQLVLPLLEAMGEAGGRASASDVYDDVATRIGLDAGFRSARAAAGGQSFNAFERDVRWAQQRAKLQGLMRPIGEGDWIITGKGERSLRTSRPGLVVTVFVTPSGQALYGSCEDAIGMLEDGSVNLIFTSPPYPLLHKKTYGNVDERTYVDWFLRIAEQWPRKLARDGSVAINLADVWRKGEPTISLYQERLLVRLEDELGLKLCQRFAWQNPSKMPVPAEWVTVRRVRVKPSLEQVYWLSASDQPYADNRQVLTPYSDRMAERIAGGGERAAKRPGGYAMRDGSFSADNGGAIPGNLITAPNTESNSAYIRQCKAAGLPVHPARFPAALPEFFVKLLTRTGDHVLDPFAGSLTTAAVAERLGRRWTACDTAYDYLAGAMARFDGARTA